VDRKTVTTLSAQSEARHKLAALVWKALPFAASPRRYLPQALAALAVLALGVMLIVTIYYTLLDLQWIAFLMGVLFAAVLSMLSQSISVRWQLSRRTAQLRRSRELLTEQSLVTERVMQTVRAAESRFRTVADALPVAIFFVDRDQRCRYHNVAFEAWCKPAPGEIDGLPLGVLLDPDIYRELEAHAAKALLGTESEYEAHWQRSDGGTSVNVRLVPYPPGAQTTSGFYVFVTPRLPARARPGAESAQGIPQAPTDEDASETIYRQAIEQQLIMDQDPREYLLRALDQDQFILLEQKIEPISSEAANVQMREVLLRLHGEQEGSFRQAGSSRSPRTTASCLP
jgi:PAS domain-containing protein